MIQFLLMMIGYALVFEGFLPAFSPEIWRTLVLLALNEKWRQLLFRCALFFSLALLWLTLYLMTVFEKDGRILISAAIAGLALAFLIEGLFLYLVRKMSPMVEDCFFNLSLIRIRITGHIVTATGVVLLITTYQSMSPGPS